MNEQTGEIERVHVVGAGPNGLAAAVAAGQGGLQVTVLEAADEIGGGTRTSEAIIPGLLHDHCSAIHPMAVGSQFLSSLGLDRYGLSWRLPGDRLCPPARRRQRRRAVPLGGATAAGLGSDGARWRTLFGTDLGSFDALVRGHHGAAAAGAAPSADAGPVRRAHRAARVHACQVVPHRGSAGRCSEVLRRMPSGRCTTR